MDTKEIEILLVEDDPVDVMNVRRAFAKARVGWPLHVATDGREALELLRGPLSSVSQNLPRIILLDINMPRMNGLEFLRELRADPTLRSISVFVLTTSNEKADLRAAYHHNVSGYILKPLSSRDFLKVITTLKHYWEICEY
ncbi:MAG: response regulator [Bacteroidota bacterium]